jgi:hypothetical protein
VRHAAAAAAIGALLLFAGCGRDQPSSDAATGATTSSGASDGYWSSRYADPARSARSVHVEPKDEAGLPPRTFDALSAIYAAPLEALGVRLTRASLIQLPAGPHLQLYAEPMGAASNADYVRRITTLAKAVVPDAFAQWPALASLDVCQEPLPGVDDSADPPPVTVLFITRAEAAAIAWDTATVTDLRRAVTAATGGELQVNAAVAADPAWTATAP